MGGGLHLLEAPSLPPPEVRLVDPRKEKVDTPTDSRGLVDISALMAIVKATIDPSYEWRPGLGIHHFYHPEVWYETDRRYEALVNPAAFRDLPVHKGLMPREFENWLHAVSLPAPRPSNEVMHYRMEAWRVASNLFKTARATIRWQRLAERRAQYVEANPEVLKDEFNGQDIIAEEIIQEILERNFRASDDFRARLERMPEEFRFVEPTFTIEEIARRLGKLMVPRAQTLVRLARN